jgi:hypothetical protein
MILSNETIEILKNFSSINQSIAIIPGTKLKTVNSLKNILAHATVKEDFPNSFAIYDLIKFLGVLSNMTEPELDFASDNKSVTISDGGTRKIKYRCADLDYIVKPEKDIDMPECEINFTLKEDVFDWINQQATVLQLNDFYFRGCEKSGNVIMGATNKKNDSEHGLSEVVDGGAKKKFNVVMKKENLKLVPGDYNISISSKGISHFKNAKSDLEYWIALEPASEYGGE